MSSPEDDMLNEGGIVPTEATPVSAIYLVPKSRIRRAADLRRKADHLYEMARLQTDAEAATACRERATLYEVLAEDLDLPRTGADPSLELEYAPKLRRSQRKSDHDDNADDEQERTLPTAGLADRPRRRAGSV